MIIVIKGYVIGDNVRTYNNNLKFNKTYFSGIGGEIGPLNFKNN